MAATCMESKKDKDILACVCVRHVLNGIVLHPQLQPELHLQKHLMNSFWTFRLMCLFLTEKKHKNYRVEIWAGGALLSETR
jgi:hypothetical protein